MKTKILSAVLLLASLTAQAQSQITINIRYKAENGNARKYVEEMESSGIADRIRAVEGCIRYDYFFPADDPEGLLLIDGWEDQEALNRYHSSPMMDEAAKLREKYNLTGRTTQMFSPRTPGNRNVGAAPASSQQVKPIINTKDMIVRISEIEVYPEYLKEYLEFAHNVGATSVREEPGVIAIYPMQQLKNECQIRILEIYASQEAYQHHIQTAHFQTYKQGTLHMVKSLDLVDMSQMAPETLPLVFNKANEVKSDWPKGNPNDAYAQYFTGNSYLAPIPAKNLTAGQKSVLSFSNVTFEPGCRNNWHVHHGARQVLVCVSGEGIYQEWGKPAIHLHAGDIIEIPEGVKHWHGAARDSWFQHLASHVPVGGTESNEWLEPVNDEQYNAANR